MRRTRSRAFRRRLRTGFIRLLAIGLGIWALILLPVALQLAANEPLPGLPKSYGKFAWVAVGILAAMALLMVVPHSVMTITNSDKSPLSHGRPLILRRTANHIGDILRHPPDEPPPITLNLAARLSIVDAPNSRFLERISDQTSKISIDSAFDAADGTLLIIGGPGAGKSQILARLAKVLLERAYRDPTRPIPMIVNLQSWKSQPISEWIVSELADRYEMPESLAEALIAEHQVEILCDGLDEASDISACIREINKFRQNHRLTSIAVCCRTNSYMRQDARLALLGAIELEELSIGQMIDYLYSGSIEISDVESALGGRQLLGELLKSPLMLNIVLRVYRANDGVLNTRSSGSTLEDYRTDLFDAYVEAMLARKRDRTLMVRTPAYKDADTFKWLTWIARSMLVNNEDRFRLDRLQFSWLKTGKISFPLIVLCSGFSSFLATIFAINIGSSEALVYGAIYGSLAGFASGLMFGVWEEEDEKSTRISVDPWWPLQQGLFRFGQRVICALILSLPLALSSGGISGVVGGLLGPWNGYVPPELRGRGSWSYWLIEKIFGTTGVKITTVITVGVIVILLAVWAMRKLTGTAKGSIIRPAEKLFWSRSTVRTRLRTFFLNETGGLRVARSLYIAINVLLGISLAITLWLDSNVNPAGIVSILVATTLGAIFVAGLAADISPYSRRPNEGLMRSARHSAIVALTICLWISLPIMIFVGILPGFVMGLLSGVVVGLLFGGYACIKYLVLRLVLIDAGCTPWRYVKFLDYATERILLRRIGGGYEFIHPLLLQHFANIGKSMSKR